MQKQSTRIVSTVVVLAMLTPGVIAQTPEEEIVRASATVVDEIMQIPARQIPQALLSEARGVVIIPNLVKGGFVVGVRHGRGVALIRDEAGGWQPPRFVTLTGGSIGFQAGLQSSDVILVFRTQQSVRGLMNGKITIGVDAAGAAGPVGRQAAVATDTTLTAEILSYSRSRGLFAGVSLDGSALQLDHFSNAAFYRPAAQALSGQQIDPTSGLPQSAVDLINRLAAYSGAPQLAAGGQPPGLQTGDQGAEPANHADLVRRQLAASWQQLSALLDQRWRAYLQPPPEALRVAAIHSDQQQLQAVLQRYAAIAADQRYVALSARPEFAATHQLLREYAALAIPKSAGELQLPPPPVSTPDLAPGR